jgi:hypothetical protein
MWISLSHRINSPSRQTAAVGIDRVEEAELMQAGPVTLHNPDETGIINGDKFCVGEKIHISKVSSWGQREELKKLNTPIVIGLPSA